MIFSITRLFELFQAIIARNVYSMWSTKVIFHFDWVPKEFFNLNFSPRRYFFEQFTITFCPTKEMTFHCWVSKLGKIASRVEKVLHFNITKRYLKFSNFFISNLNTFIKKNHQLRKHLWWFLKNICNSFFPKTLI